MKYLPATVLLACACLIAMPLAFQIVLLCLGVALTICAMLSPIVPLINYTVIKAADPMFALMAGADADGDDEQKGDFDYE